MCFHNNDLSDRQSIYDLMATYCQGIDRADYVRVRSVYAEDGVDHHTGFSGPADDYVEWLRVRTAGFTGTMHNIGTHTSVVTGDEATAETYGTAHHWGAPSDDPALNFTSGFRYLDRLRRTADGWKVVERFAVREWTRSDAGRLQAPEGEGPRGARGAADPLYTHGFATHGSVLGAAEQQNRCTADTRLSYNDYREIHEVKSRYFRAVDTHNLDLMRDVFTPDAEFVGYGFGIRSGVETLIETLAATLGRVTSGHQGFNPEVQEQHFTQGTPNPAKAHVLWTFRDELRWDENHTSLNAPGVSRQIGIRGGGYYQDEMVRTPVGWRISRSQNTRTHLDALTEHGAVPLPVKQRPLDARWLQPGRATQNEDCSF